MNVVSILNMGACIFLSQFREHSMRRMLLPQSSSARRSVSRSLLWLRLSRNFRPFSAELNILTRDKTSSPSLITRTLLTLFRHFIMRFRIAGKFAFWEIQAGGAILGRGPKWAVLRTRYAI